MKLIEYPRQEVRASPEVQAILGGFQLGVDGVRKALADAAEQLDVQTATWGLALWEDALGLTTQAEKDTDYRRTRVLAKLRGPGTTTAEAIRNVAASFSGGAVEVVEVPAEYRIEVHFVDTVGLPPNLNDLKAAIEEIVPAHLAVGYVSTLKTWDDVSGMTWDSVAALTWEELRGGTL